MKRLLLPFLLAATSASAFDVQLEWGHPLPEDRNAKWSLSYGSLLDISGHVDETFRAYYKASGQNWKQSLAESYSLSDFGVDAPYSTMGLSYEKQWTFWNFRWDLVRLSLDASATAKRNYYLGVGDDIHYGGRSYDHLKIPKGSRFSLDFDGFLTSGAFALTPFTFWLGEELSFTPELDAGLVLVLGKYKIDAGKARGTAVYQNPPVDFVVGGSSDSFIGAGAPMIGFGGELRLGAEDWIQWIFRANLGYFSYSGSTKPFTSSGHRAKDLDLDYFSLTFDAAVDLPMTETTCLELGARLQYMDIAAEIKSKEKDDAAIVAARERFDKKADFDAVSLLFYAGVTF